MTASGYVEYFFLHYVPHVISDESVSIAAIFVDPTDLEQGTCKMRFAADWQTKVQLLDPDADLEVLGALLTEIQDRLLSQSERSDMIRQLEDSFSNVVQASERRKCPVNLSPESIESLAWELLDKTSKISRSSPRMPAPRCDARH
jgi:Protein of unknown function (DUF3037)